MKILNESKSFFSYILANYIAWRITGRQMFINPTQKLTQLNQRQIKSDKITN